MRDINRKSNEYPRVISKKRISDYIVINIVSY